MKISLLNILNETLSDKDKKLFKLMIVTKRSWSEIVEKFNADDLLRILLSKNFENFSFYDATTPRPNPQRYRKFIEFEKSVYIGSYNKEIFNLIVNLINKRKVEYVDFERITASTTLFKYETLSHNYQIVGKYFENEEHYNAFYIN